MGAGCGPRRIAAWQQVWGFQVLRRPTTNCHLPPNDHAQFRSADGPAAAMLVNEWENSNSGTNDTRPEPRCKSTSRRNHYQLVGLQCQHDNKGALSRHSKQGDKVSNDQYYIHEGPAVCPPDNDFPLPF